VDAIGGHLCEYQVSDGLFFGMIVSLSGPNALPSGSPFDTTTLATTDFMANWPSTDLLTPLSVVLPPGDYALIFGGHVGAQGGMPDTNTDIPGQASYFWWDGFGSNWYDGGFRNTRFVVTGTVIPEPSTLIIWSLLATLGITVTWWRQKRRAG